MRIIAAAKKGFPRAYMSFILSVCGGLVLACSLLGLQQGCWNNAQDLSVESYCFCDNNPRAIVSAISIVTLWLIGLAIVTAICSFRTAKVSTGIRGCIHCPREYGPSKMLAKLENTLVGSYTAAVAVVLRARRPTSPTQRFYRTCANVCCVVIQYCCNSRPHKLLRV